MAQFARKQRGSSRDRACNRRGPPHGGRPPDGANAPAKVVPQLSRFKLRGSDKTSCPVDLIGPRKDALSYELGVMSPEFTKFVVATEAPSNGGSSSGGGKEWSGPVWQFCKEDDYVSLILNIVKNIELLTPVGRKFQTDPYYNGDGVPPPQREPAFCAINNVYDFKTAVLKAKQEALSRTWHSQRERVSNDKRPETGEVGAEPAVLPVKHVSRKTKTIRSLGAPSVIKPKATVVEPSANDDPFRGDTRQDSLDYLPMNLGISLHLEGCVHLSSATLIELSGPDTVRITHRNEFGLLFQRLMDEDEFYELIDKGTSSIHLDQVLGSLSLTVEAAESLLEIPCESTHGLWSAFPEEMENYWLRRNFMSNGTVHPVFYVDQHGRSMETVDCTNIGVWFSDPEIDRWDIPVLDEVVEDPVSNLVSSNWVEEQWKQELEVVDDVVEQLRREHYEYAAGDEYLLGDTKYILSDDEATYYQRWVHARMFQVNPAVVSKKTARNPELELFVLKEDVRYQLWLMAHDIFQTRDDDSYAIAHRSRSHAFFASVEEVPLPMGTRFSLATSVVKGAAKSKLRQWFGLASKPSIEPIEAVVVDTSKAEADVLVNKDVLNDSVNNAESARIGEMLGEEHDPRRPPPPVEVQAVKLALSETEADVYSSGGIFLGKQKGLVRTEAGLILPQHVRPASQKQSVE